MKFLKFKIGLRIGSILYKNACTTSDMGVPQKSFKKRFLIGTEGCKSLLSKMAETSSKTKPQNRLFQ